MPLKVAETGPILTLATAAKPLSPALSSDWHPGMQVFRTSGIVEQRPDLRPRGRESRLPGHRHRHTRLLPQRTDDRQPPSPVPPRCRGERFRRCIRSLSLTVVGAKVHIRPQVSLFFVGCAAGSTVHAKACVTSTYSCEQLEHSRGTRSTKRSTLLSPASKSIARRCCRLGLRPIGFRCDRTRRLNAPMRRVKRYEKKRRAFGQDGRASGSWHVSCGCWRKHERGPLAHG